MTAVLSACCSCGRVASAPCPTLGAPDRAGAFIAIESAGFRWHDGIGYRCLDWPACDTAGAAPVPPGPSQADLFGATGGRP